jgi:type IV pilus assembly protein PilM
MPDNEIQNAVSYELEQDIPIPIDQVYLDWQLMQQGADAFKVLVTATPKDYVDSLISVLHAIKLRPLGLELESQATARALIGAQDISKPILIIDLSTTQTSFVIVQNGIIEYTSSIPMAGRAFTESISRILNVPLQKAEELKQTTGLSGPDAQAPVRQAILPVLDSIVEEIKKVIRFFDEHSSAKKSIDGIFLCGGSAQLSGIAEYISAHLDPEPNSPQRRIVLGNPWVNVESMAQKPAAASGESLGFVTAIGLGLRGCEYENN